MNYENFTNEQQSLKKIALKYKDDATFRAAVDQDPRTAFANYIANSSGTVEIVHDSENLMHFVIDKNPNQSINDEDASGVVGAKIKDIGDIDGVHITFNTDNNLYSTSEGKRFRWIPEKSNDDFGSYIRVDEAGNDILGTGWTAKN